QSLRYPRPVCRKTSGIGADFGADFGRRRVARRDAVRGGRMVLAARRHLVRVGGHRPERLLVLLLSAVPGDAVGYRRHLPAQPAGAAATGLLSAAAPRQGEAPGL